MASRILLFTGKGGVGKTTCAAATAVRAAEQGYKTLVISSDPAHSLADALDRELGPEPEEVLPNLFAQEVDLYYSMQKYWGNMREMLLMVFKWQGVSEVAAEEMAALPGMNEGSVLLWLEQAHREGDYDLIVVDSAPTGETLTLLTLPQVTQWWVAKAFPFQKAAVKTVGYAMRKTTGIPLDKGYDELNELFDQLKVIHDVLSDPAISSVRLVVNPEKMVLEEARRAYTYLQLYGYGVDAVLVNRVFPKEGVGPALEKYVAAQDRYLAEIDGSFAPLPILQVPHLGEEVFGVDLLRRIGEHLYGRRDNAERDPTGIFYHEPTYRVTSDNGTYRLEIRLPFVEDEDIHLHRSGEELVIQIGNQRRNYLLPRFLSYYTLTDSHFEDGWLRVRFVSETR